MLHPSSMPPTDIRDKHHRVTFADVAMRIARDGPMYGVIILVGVLALKGTTSALESILGAAFALQARSRPPAEIEKGGKSLLTILAVGAGTVGVAHAITACGGG